MDKQLNFQSFIISTFGFPQRGSYTHIRELYKLRSFILWFLMVKKKIIIRIGMTFNARDWKAKDVQNFGMENFEGNNSKRDIWRRIILKSILKDYFGMFVLGLSGLRLPIAIGCAGLSLSMKNGSWISVPKSSLEYLHSLEIMFFVPRSALCCPEVFF